MEDGTFQLSCIGQSVDSSVEVLRRQQPRQSVGGRNVREGARCLTGALYRFLPATNKLPALTAASQKYPLASGYVH